MGVETEIKEDSRKPVITVSGSVLNFSVLLILAGFMIYMYADITDTIENSVLLLRCISEGHIRDFYEYSVANSTTLYAANYSFFTYIIWAIWNIPIFLSWKIYGANYLSSPPALMWGKLPLILAAVTAVLLMNRIAAEIIKEKDDNGSEKDGAFAGKGPGFICIFAFFGSSAFLLSLVILTQIDIIALDLILLGVLFYITNREKMFIIAFALAMPFKTFALFVFLPLLLLKEKNILKIVGKTLCIFILPLTEALLFGRSAIYRAALGSQARDAFRQLLGPNFPSGTCIFILVFVAVMVYCFLAANRSRREIIYICFLVLGSFVTFVQITTYWVILMLPFLVIIIAAESRGRILYLLLEAVASFCFFMEEAITSPPLNEDGMLINRLLLRPLSGRSEAVYSYDSMIDMFTRHGIDQCYEAFFSIFMACMLLLLILTHPRIADRAGEKLEIKNPVSATAVLILRAVLFATVFWLPLHAYGAVDRLLFSNREYADQEYGIKIMDEDVHSVVQVFKLSNDGTARKLKLRLKNNNSTRSDFSSVKISLYEIGKEEPIAEKIIGCSLIPADSDTVISFRKTEFKKDTEYEIRIEGIEGVNAETAPVPEVYASSSIFSYYGQLYIDGESCGGELYFELGE